MGLQFVSIFLLFLLPSISTIEITACDCSKPIPVGILDPAIPSYCNVPKVQTNPILIDYEIFTAIKPKIEWDGHICLQWEKTKRIVGYFFGGYDTTFTERTVDVAPNECWRMVLLNLCGDNKMTHNGEEISFIAEPKGEGQWFSDITYSATSCVLQDIKLRKDCVTCPIKTPSLGIITEDQSSNFIIRNHHTVVWNTPPYYDQNACELKRLHRGVGKLTDFDLDNFRLLDDKGQLEYIFAKNITTACKRTNIRAVNGIPSTYVSYRNKSDDNLNTVFEQPGEIMTAKQTLCLAVTDSIQGPSKLTTIPCGLPKYKFLFQSGKLFYENFCIDSRTLMVTSCSNATSTWTFNNDNGLISVDQNLCLTVSSNSKDVIFSDCNNVDDWIFEDMDNQNIALMVEHHQFMEAEALKRENLLAVEIQQSYCETLRIKKYTLLHLAAHDGHLAAKTCMLPLCTFLSPVGEFLLVRKCRAFTTTVESKLTDCGHQPVILNDQSISLDGYTMVPQDPCIWKNGIINLNSVLYDYVNDTWHKIGIDLKLSTLPLIDFFNETLDLEFTYVPKIHPTYEEDDNVDISEIIELLSKLPRGTTFSSDTQFQSQDVAPRPKLDLSFQSVTSWWQSLKHFFVIALGIFLLLVFLRVWYYCYIKYKIRNLSVREPVEIEEEEPRWGEGYCRPVTNQPTN